MLTSAKFFAYGRCGRLRPSRTWRRCTESRWRC